MKVIILHLERAKDRKTHMLNEVKKHGLDFEFFKAFDFLSVKNNDFSTFCDMDAMKKHPTWLTPGMVCACYSHYLIYQKIIEENIDCALIVEDDVVFCDDIVKVLDNVEANIKTNEAVLLHYISWSPLSLIKKSVVPILGQFNLYTPKDKCPEVSSAAGYIITRETAKTLSNIVFPIKYGTDSWDEFTKHGGVKSIRFVHPRPVNVAGFKSNATPSNYKIWNSITGFVDRHKIPILFQVFRRLRLRSMENRSKITFN